MKKRTAETKKSKQKLPEGIYSDDLKEFITHLKIEKSLSDNTINSYSFDIIKFTSFLKSKSYSSYLSADQILIEQFLSSLKPTHRPSSIARILSALRQFYNFLIKNSVNTEQNN